MAEIEMSSITAQTVGRSSSAGNKEKYTIKAEETPMKP
jgi:hypothetical protein